MFLLTTKNSIDFINKKVSAIRRRTMACDRRGFFFVQLLLLVAVISLAESRDANASCNDTVIPRAKIVDAIPKNNDKWFKIFSHNMTLNTTFIDKNDTRQKNELDANAALYSVVLWTERYRNHEDLFHFKLIYPETEEYVEWIQVSIHLFKKFGKKSPILSLKGCIRNHFLKFFTHLSPFY